MPSLPLILLSLFALGATPPALAQGHGHDARADHAVAATDYTALLERDIKALSPGEQAGLASGAGLGMALAAELNGYPGPRHVLELADTLALSAAQRDATQAVFDAMAARARVLGAEIIALERALDEAFAARTVTRAALERQVAEIGQRRAQLRAVHLAAHLETTELLSAEQRARYARARGYAR